MNSAAEVMEEAISVLTNDERGIRKATAILRAAIEREREREPIIKDCVETALNVWMNKLADVQQRIKDAKCLSSEYESLGVTEYHLQNAISKAETYGGWHLCSRCQKILYTSASHCERCAAAERIEKGETE